MSTKASSGIKAAVAGLAALFIFSKIVWGLILLAAGILLFRTVPVLTEKTLKSAVKTPWNHMLLGLVIAIVAPIIAIIFAVTIVGLPVTIFIVMALVLLAIVVHIYTALLVGTKIMDVFGGTQSQAVTYLLGLVALAILHFVPVIGPLVCGALGLLMLGAIMREKSTAFKRMREKKIV